MCEFQKLIRCRPRLSCFNSANFRSWIYPVLTMPGITLLIVWPFAMSAGEGRPLKLRGVNFNPQ